MAATQQVRVTVAAGASGTLFAAVAGARNKLIKGVIAIAPLSTATGAIVIYEQAPAATSTVMYIGMSSVVPVLNFDFGPEGMCTSATNSGFAIGLTASGGTLTAWFLGTTE
jgi:hypothetical protein